MTTPPYTPGNPYEAPQPQPMNPADEKLWATLIQVGSLFIGFLVPLIGFLVLKDRGPFVRAYAATALNFQLTLIIAYIVGGILSIVLVGLVVILAAWVLNVVFCIIAAVKANQGEWYTYPLSIPFFR